MWQFLVGMGVGAVVMLIAYLRFRPNVIHHRHSIGHVIQYMEHRKIKLLGEDKQNITTQISEN